MKKLVIFDLDGTLLNTIEDLARSTNYALKQAGFPQHPIEKYKFFVGNGINKLFERALPEGARTPENVLDIRKEFLPYYDAHNAEYTRPYPSIPELLHTLQTKGYKLAVASNKYQKATEKLIGHYFPEVRFTAVFGQQEHVPIKPDPTIIHNIMQIAGVTKEEVMYIGDSGVDMQTAFNSGVCSIGVTWGFRPKSELEENKAVHIIDKPEEALLYLV
ncbi:HAD family hydrolase [Parabacteroides pacaensis]|uniref:HAD family hydrolase n=1 Tax=Parabacteroides pacaensis TaxID=2086575 RepID=UPI000D0FDA17|nr:HAD family hydrolase [Parabacteroides pacaensis]